MSIETAIHDWREFYGAVANAGAALLGLVFVGVSIHLSMRRMEPRTRLLGMESVANLLHPVLVALVMLLPVQAVAQGISLLALSVIGLPGMLYVAWAKRRCAPDESMLAIAYRYYLPLLATVIGVAGAVGLIIGLPLAVLGPAVYVFLMSIVGTQNAWDLLLGSYGGSNDADRTSSHPTAEAITRVH